jgi:dihydrofolate synthase/folylpolyglutamate synthase
MNYKQTIQYLETLQTEDPNREWTLEPMQELMEKLGYPHVNLGTVIHVTGTNGKGSVCAMLAQILKTTGYKTALYTSPHLNRVTERIKINNEEISKEDFAAYITKVQPYVTLHSFFEVVTAAAFLYFADKKAEVSIIEVGMGGRLDATNIVESTISVVTNISLEHTKRLGKTEESIAKEKAGIIKEGTLCVTAATGDAYHVIQKICTEKNVQLIHAKPTEVYHLSLHGEMQKENAGIVVAVIDALKKRGFEIPKIHIAEGLQTTHWPGRLDFIEKNVLVDVAHNPGGMAQLANELKKFKEQFKKVIMVLGILSDKDWKVMLDEIVPVADTIILTKPQSERAAEPDSLHRYLSKSYGIDAQCIENIKMALEKAKHIATHNDLIVVTGSFYTVGPIYKKK